MFGFLKRLFGIKPPRNHKADPDDIAMELWQADFSREDEPNKAPHVRFSIISENLYRAYLDNNALCLGVKKTGCMAWTENMIFRYQDLNMKGRFILDPLGGYAAAGFIFRMVDDLTYYMALVSSRGYFRLDLVRNSVPLALAGWTEAPGMKDSKGAPIEFDLELVTSGSRILLLINGHWAGAWNDPSISEGRISFIIASYESNGAPEIPVSSDEARQSRGSLPDKEFTALAKLVEFSLDSRIEEVEKRYDELENSALPDSHIRLAETYAAVGLAGPALGQLHKAWEIRATLAEKLNIAEDAVVLAAIQDENPDRKAKELLLGAKLALALELWDEAEEYIEAALNAEEIEREARSLKAALLYSRSRYTDLIRLAEEASETENNDVTTEAALNYKKLDSLYADPPSFYNLLGHAYFNTGNYQKAAEVYDRSFALDEKNSIAAKNAAAAYELLNQTVSSAEARQNRDSPLDQNKKALDRYLKAGRVFLADNRYEELGLLIPKFRLLGEENWEARSLTGKWAFGIEDWETARKELSTAESFRKAKRNPPDPALYFLQALLLVREGRRKEALPLFEKAVKYAPDYPLFRFRLAENRLLLNNNPHDPQLAADLETILTVSNNDESYGWIHNFAAHAALSKGNVEAARSHMDIAAAALGEIPAVRVNRAVSFYLQGLEAEALSILESKPEDDPEGLMANCAGNLLVRSRRFEEADIWYRRALAIAPLNMQYRYNRGSCLIELKHYGEADDVLTTGADSKKFSPETNPDMLELIAFVAVKKGEYKRAEAAVQAALKIDPDHAPSLLQMGWLRAFMGRWDKVGEILNRLDGLEISEESSRGRDDLEARMKEALYKTISCASCKREWQIERDPEPAASLRLYAMPPDDMPAGTCPGCGNTYCVGCRKETLDESGRFVCPDCNKTLKLTDDGLKALLNDWTKRSNL